MEWQPVFDIIKYMANKITSLKSAPAWLMVTILLFGAVAYAEDAGDRSARPKVGLVLSGGGAKGFAHIGALKVIDDAGLQVDYIAGTSMGAVIGALYAIGYSPAQIERIALEQNWLDLFDDAASREYLLMGEKDRLGIYSVIFPIKKGRVDLPLGLIPGQKLQALIARLAWPAVMSENFDRLPIPFCCVATDLETGRPVTLNGGSLSEAVRASMSIPTIFAPVKIKDQWLIDGGVTDNLPAAQASAMGAEVLIGVDVSAKLRSRDQLASLVDVLDQTVNFQSYASVEEQRKLCAVLITPELAEYTPANFNRVEEIFKRGQDAARRSLPELERVMDSLDLGRSGKGLNNSAAPESLYVKGVEVDGLSKVSKKLVLDQLDLPVSGWLTAGVLDQAIDRVYSTQFFEKVSYRLVSAGPGAELRIEVIEKSHQVLGLGFRYDSNTNAEVLAGYSIRNLLGHSSLLAADLRLGGRPELRLSESIHAGIGPGLGARLDIRLSQFPVYLYQQEERWASLKYRTFKGEVFLGTIYSKLVEIGGSLGFDYFRVSPDVAPVGFEISKDHHLIFGLSLDLDTYDKRDFPCRGQKITLSHKMANSEFGGEADFYKKFWQWQGRYPVHKKFSVGHDVFWGNVSGKDIPIHYRFYVGGLDQRQGIIPLAGLKPMELNGNNVMGAGVGAQYEILPGRFLSFGWNLAKAGDGQWQDQFVRQGLVSGVSFGAGILTPAGPVRLDLMGGSRHSFLAHLRLGYNF